MRALAQRATGLVFERDYPMPIRADGEALIRVLLAGICNTDLEIVCGYMNFQGVPGHEFVGMVEEALDTSGIPSASPLVGQRVVGEINAACRRRNCWYCQHDMLTHCPNRTTPGIVNRDGAFAEYLTLPLENLHIVPAHLSNEEAVFVEPLAANFEILEQAHLKPTDRVMILGDGKMGQGYPPDCLSQICSEEVMMVGKHEEKLALAAKRGIQTYALADPETFALEDGQRVDLVVECSGSAQGLEMALRLVRPRGTVILKSTVADMSTLHMAPVVIDEIRVQGSRCGPFAPTLRALRTRQAITLSIGTP